MSCLSRAVAFVGHKEPARRFRSLAAQHLCALRPHPGTAWSAVGLFSACVLGAGRSRLRCSHGLGLSCSQAELGNGSCALFESEQCAGAAQYLPRCAPSAMSRPRTRPTTLHGRPPCLYPAPPKIPPCLQAARALVSHGGGLGVRGPRAARRGLARLVPPHHQGTTRCALAARHARRRRRRRRAGADARPQACRGDGALEGCGGRKPRGARRLAGPHGADPAQRAVHTPRAAAALRGGRHLHHRRPRADRAKPVQADAAVRQRGRRRVPPRQVRPRRVEQGAPHLSQRRQGLPRHGRQPGGARCAAQCLALPRRRSPDSSPPGALC